MNLYFFPDFSPQLLTFMFHCFLDTFYGSVSEATQTHLFQVQTHLYLQAKQQKNLCIGSLYWRTGPCPGMRQKFGQHPWNHPQSTHLILISVSCYVPSLLSPSSPFITVAETSTIFLSRPSMTCPLYSRILDLRFNQLILKCASDVLFSRFQTRHHHCSQLWSEKPLIAGEVVNSVP